MKRAASGAQLILPPHPNPLPDGGEGAGMRHSLLAGGQEILAEFSQVA